MSLPVSGTLPDARPLSIGLIDRKVAYLSLTVLLFLGLTAIVVLTFPDYGISWDEEVQNVYGRDVLNYYVTGLRDTSFVTYLNLYLYGASFDVLAAVANLISPLGVYETRHLINALVGLFGIYGCWRLTKLAGGTRAALLSAALLAMMPVWYGHMFNNPKDIPFAVGMTWTTYFLARMAAHLPRVPRSITIKLGLALGLTLGTRIAGVMLLVYVAAIFLGFLAHRLARGASVASVAREGLRAAACAIGPALIIGYVVMLVCWPSAQQGPIDNPIEAIHQFSHFPFDVQIYFFGRLVDSSKLPATYLPGYLAVQMPELVLGLVLAAVPLLVLQRRRRTPKQQVALAVLGLATVFPFVYVWAGRPVLYNATRHFLFLLPLLACVAGLAADRLVDLAGRLSNHWQLALGMGLSVYVAYHVSLMMRLHPDEYVYYNALVGGVPGAVGRFDLDYWSNSYAEAARKLADYLQRESPDNASRTFRIAVCGDNYVSAGYYLPPNMMSVDDETTKADFMFCDEWDGRAVVQVKRLGATLTRVIDLRPGPRPVPPVEPTVALNHARP